MLDARVRGVLTRLELEDEHDRALSRPSGERSLAIAPSTGALLYALCARQPRCAVLEIGGSRGYSTIWLAAAVQRLGGRVTSLEADPRKLERSARNIADAGLDDWVEVVPGDALTTLPRLEGPYDVVFLDAWKDDYERLFALVLPLVAPGGVVAADNVLSHVEILGRYSAARQADPRLLSVTIPLDNGLELTSVGSCRLHSG
jgi:predicted O-methyltransferase YrrM